MTDLCRLCGEYKPLEELSCITDADSCVAFKLESCLKIILDQDKLLPKCVCSICNSMLDVAFKFAEQVSSVQEKLKLDLQEQLDSIPYDPMCDFDNIDLDEYNKFEVKVERMDPSLYEMLPPSRFLRRRKTPPPVIKRQPKPKQVPKPKKEPQPPKVKKIFKKDIEWDDEELQIRPVYWKLKKNFGIKAPSLAIKFRMEDLFKNELRGKFSAQTHDTDFKEEDKAEDGTLTDRMKQQLASVGWFNYQWKCIECDESFSTVYDLEKHSLKIHEKKCSINCELCCKIFLNYTTFLNHVVSMHQPMLKYCCLICSEFHTSFLHLHKHIEVAHPTYEVFICLYCGEIKYTGAVMRLHILDKHVLDVNLILSCDLCDQTFSTKYKVFSHMTNHHIMKAHICEICGIVYKHRIDMIRHQTRAHDDNFEAKCKFCGKIFTSNRQLRCHIKRMHVESKLRFSCEVCGKVSKSRQSHNQHMKVHSDDLPFKCKYCDRAFKTRAGRQYHIRTHTGERPYSCPNCDVKFVDYPNARKHIKTTHGLKDVKPILSK